MAAKDVDDYFTFLMDGCRLQDVFLWTCVYMRVFVDLQMCAALGQHFRLSTGCWLRQFFLYLFFWPLATK